MAKERILVIEDEPDIAELIEYNLVREGYWVSVTADGEEGFDRVVSDSPDLVMLDLMLPGTDGLELCRRLKEDPVTREIPIIMVTAKTEESDVVLGLGVGADDYVPKPFSPKELVARVRAVLRRGKVRVEATGKERIRRGELSVDAVRHQVKLHDRDVPFTATEFRLLHMLASHPGRAFTREQLLSRVIGESAAVTDRNIDVHIRTIRKKLDDHRDLIETVRGVGYRFRED
ncbi:MAG: response regulator [Gemmatimonadetes bacterium]|nr:response regulator [Gemmatimonadota bacterium]